MLRSRCAFCAHENPVDSKFCNECGAPLHLALCAQCEAVNDALARNCYRCGAAMSAQLGDDAVPRAWPPPSVNPEHVPETFARWLEAGARVEPTLSPAPTLTPAPMLSPEQAPSPEPLLPREPTLALEPSPSPDQAPSPEPLLPHERTLAFEAVTSPEATLPRAATARRKYPPDTVSPVSAPPSSTGAMPNEPDASTGVVESIVMPADEVRLAATRDMIAAQRRQRIARSALIAIALLCAVPILYYELFGGEPLDEWLRRWNASWRPVSSAPSNGAGASVVVPTPANADAAQPSSTPPPAAAVAAPEAASAAAPSTDGAAAGSDVPRGNDEPKPPPETPPAAVR